MRKFIEPKIFSAFSLSSKRALLFFSFLLLLASCTLNKSGKNLDPESKKFLSQVTYVITKEERKIFLNLPPSERKGFIDEFWKRRDPNPDTEENEFKDEYFKRIEEANHLFKEGGTPGWLQDRGRIYILLGPPDQREVYPSGQTFYGEPIEIWYYGFLPVVFIDSQWSGDYKLYPLSAAHVAEINKAQIEGRPKITGEKVIFDFGLKIDNIGENQAIILIKIPYKNIWFIEEENKLKTTLDLSIAIFDSYEKKLWEHQEKYPISLDKDNLEEFFGKDCVIRIPVILEPGDYTCTVELKNESSENVVRKKITFTF